MPQMQRDLGAIRVEQAPHRCPFCHEGCPAAGSVACEVCLARHHAACWDEAGRCAACAAPRPLVPPGAHEQGRPQGVVSRGGAALLLTVLASLGTWLVIARWYGEAIMRGWLLGPADMALLASAVVPCCALGVRALLRDRGPALGAVACLIVSGVLGVATSSTSWGGYGPTHHPGTIAAWVLTGALTGAAAALAPELFARAGALRRKG